jgi:hypothetical protein
MKIGVVSSKEEIDFSGANEQMIHLTFRTSNTDILSIVMKCPTMKALHLPLYYMKAISRPTEMMIGSLHTWHIRKHAYRSGFV